MNNSLFNGALLTCATALVATIALGHGDMTPQAVDTKGLPEVGEEWLAENPYRNAEGDVRARAIEVGAAGFNSNCARCHGLEAISGGLAPDLRYLEPSAWGDEWYLERFRSGYTQNGVTKMPSFEG
ncbi:MAG: cytochrome c-550 PedF, partial [Pseudomonadota bacterium]